MAREDVATDQLYEEVREMGHAFQDFDRLFLKENGTPFPELTWKYGVF